MIIVEFKRRNCADWEVDPDAEEDYKNQDDAEEYIRKEMNLSHGEYAFRIVQTEILKVYENP